MKVGSSVAMKAVRMEQQQVVRWVVQKAASLAGY